MNELSASNQSQDSQPPKKKHKKDALTTLFEDMPTPSENSRFTSEDKIETELLKYSHEATISYDSNPLEWWKMKYDIYPNMSMQVKKIWSLPASSVRSEEIFSTAGNILTLKRNRLLPEHVDMLVFLHSSEWC